MTNAAQLLTTMPAPLCLPQPPGAWPFDPFQYQKTCEQSPQDIKSSYTIDALSRSPSPVGPRSGRSSPGLPTTDPAPALPPEPKAVVVRPTPRTVFVDRSTVEDTYLRALITGAVASASLQMAFFGVKTLITIVGLGGLAGVSTGAAVASVAIIACGVIGYLVAEQLYQATEERLASAQRFLSSGPLADGARQIACLDTEKADLIRRQSVGAGCFLALFRPEWTMVNVITGAFVAANALWVTDVLFSMRQRMVQPVPHPTSTQASADVCLESVTVS
jgi:hypothetical protein